MVPSPGDGLPPPARERYEALRARFLAGLPARWEEIAGAADPAARAAALHRLAGAAGSYGYDELGRVARVAEQRAGDASGPARAALAEVHRLVQELAQT